MANYIFRLSEKLEDIEERLKFKGIIKAEENLAEWSTCRLEDFLLWNVTFVEEKDIHSMNIRKDVKIVREWDIERADVQVGCVISVARWDT